MAEPHRLHRDVLEFPRLPDHRRHYITFLMQSLQEIMELERSARF